MVVDSLLSADAPASSSSSSSSTHQAGALLPTDTVTVIGTGGVRSQDGGAAAAVGGYVSGPYLCRECNLTTDFPPEPYFCISCNRVTQQTSPHATDRSMHATDRSIGTSFMTRSPLHRNSDAMMSHYTHYTGRSSHQANTFGSMKPSSQWRDGTDLRGFLETEEDILNFTLNESRRDAGLDGYLKPRSPRSASASGVSKKNVDLMMSMGFSKQLAHIALGENGNNVDKAVNAIVNNRSTALINVRPNATAAYGRS